MIYSPAEDSFLLASHLSPRVKNKKVLDMCAGSGIISQEAIKCGAKSVLSVDINESSVKHMKSLGLNALKSDLFAKVKGKFDIMLCNPPYLPEDAREDDGSRLATTGGKRGDEIILKFLKQSTKHLNIGGKILLILSSLTPRKNILSLMKKLRFKKTILESKKFFMESLELWEFTREQ